jgi:hypothetical protein
VEDAYTYYVLMLDIPETIFWDSDLSFLLGVVDNKSAYNTWLSWAEEKQSELNKKKARR